MLGIRGILAGVCEIACGATVEEVKTAIDENEESFRQFSQTTGLDGKAFYSTDIKEFAKIVNEETQTK